MFVFALFLAAFSSGARAQVVLATLGDLASNTSAMIGGNASFYCEVVGELSFGQSLQFDKILGDGDSLFIFGSDKNPDLEVVDSAKYEVTGKYTLHVKNITWEDEGLYRCKLDAVDTNPHQASLTVVDPPDTMKMYWPGDRDWTASGIEANLTCKAGRSRPPATMTWMRGTTDITGVALAVDVNVDKDGYGEGMSYLELTPSQSELGIIYTCKVNVPGVTAHLTQQLLVSFSGSTPIISSIALLIAAIVTSSL